MEYPPRKASQVMEYPPRKAEWPAAESGSLARCGSRGQVMEYPPRKAGRQPAAAPMAKWWEVHPVRLGGKRRRLAPRGPPRQPHEPGPTSNRAGCRQAPESSQAGPGEKLRCARHVGAWALAEELDAQPRGAPHESRELAPEQDGPERASWDQGCCERLAGAA